jgi:hypothetical protein
MDKLLKRSEIVANVAIIALAIMLGFFLVKKEFFSTPNNPKPDFEIATGTKISLPDIDWAKNNQTLIIALKTGCHFCKESAPFYQQLTKEVSNNSQLIFMLPESVSEGEKYLKEMEVPNSKIRQIDLDTIKVKGTPSLILVDNQGIVKRSWVGKLSPEKEAEVLGELHCKTCG